FIRELKRTVSFHIFVQQSAHNCLPDDSVPEMLVTLFPDSEQRCLVMPVALDLSSYPSGQECTYVLRFLLFLEKIHHLQQLMHELGSLETLSRVLTVVAHIITILCIEFFPEIV